MKGLEKYTYGSFFEFFVISLVSPEFRGETAGDTVFATGSAGVGSGDLFII